MPTRILYCHCAFAQAVPRPVKQDVLRALTDAGVDFDAVADLCEMSARKDPALKELAASEHLTLRRLLPARGALDVQRRRRAARRVAGPRPEHARRRPPRKSSPALDAGPPAPAEPAAGRSRSRSA